ncbi:UDP-N-acetylglucosamine pyrophosphorylase [Apophysomyces sp. BC1034]|nr:UDP-N-acetylglucosamine pyrophosphorylase [Apophysomyces sp. BC1015]KAG0176191.1 UDP-N-acetylglucosamine pyrophosphorylase [Apophysomyces sp. BC1021]KAG0190010.1 UDP-N-acetylglucosamine pyrophosphorylase [Apophysomyces sp. BC1034]
MTCVPFNDTELQTLKTRFNNAGQGHVFRFFDELSSVEEQVALYEQLKTIDVERLNQIYLNATTTEAGVGKNGDASLEPLNEQVFDSVLNAHPDTIRTWETVGMRQIAQNKVAVILMAGGQGTRLGSSDPKGCYDIGLPSRKSLFQLQAERILRLQDLARQYKKPGQEDCVIPWYVMTSGPTHEPTYAFFKANQFFGLDENNVIFFEQGTLPCLTMDGKIILESKNKVAVAPDGNGGIYAAIQKKGVIRSLRERGIEYTHCYSVDNCLARVADPVFIGYCVSRSTDCGVKVVRKATPEEPVGVVCVRNGRYSVVEYSEISPEMCERRRPEDGSLLFGAANIANHFFSTDFLERVPSFAPQLEYHIAKKKITYTDLQSGEQISPKANSGMKLECFVFDVFPFADHMAVLEVDRQEEFSPLKNASGAGVDCPETSRRDIVAQHLRFIEAAGGKVVCGDRTEEDIQNLPFEISPWVTYAGEGIRDIVQGKTITLPAVIETKQDLLRLAK